MANLQTRIHSSPSKNLSWIRPGYEPPKISNDQESNQDQEAEIDDAAPFRRPRPSPGKSSVPLLDRIQMDREDTRDIGQTEKSLIERIGIAPDDMSALLYRSTSLWAPRHEELDRNDGKEVSSGSEYHSPKRATARKSERFARETGAYKQSNSRDGSNDSEDRPIPSSHATSPHSSDIHPDSPLKDDTANKDTTSQVTQSSPSMTPEVFIDRFLPLAQQIADGRREDSKDGTISNGLVELKSSMITDELLGRFSEQLMKLSKDLELHRSEDHERKVFPTEKTQEVTLTENENRASVTWNHHPTTTEQRGAPEPSAGRSMGHSAPVPGKMNQIFGSAATSEPSATWSREIPIPLPIVRTPTPEYLERLERKRRSSLSYKSHHDRDRDMGRRYTTSFEHRRTSGDFTQHDYRLGNGKRDWDYHDQRRRGYAKHWREDSDRRSTSPRQRAPYPPTRHDRRNSSPTRYHRRSSNERLPYRRRPRSRSRSRSRELAHRSYEKPKHDSVFASRRHTESVSNHFKGPYVQRNSSGSRLLQEIFEEQNGAASSRQVSRSYSGLDVPGLWFVSQGLRDIGMSASAFEIDEPMALKWNLRPKENDHIREGTEGFINGQTRLQLSLELSCFSLHDVRMTVQNLGREVKFCDFVKALSKLKNAWPPQGHLIISINEESHNQKYWFPRAPTQKGPIQLEEFVHEGTNFVRFIQLSDLSRNIFVLLANRIETVHPLLPYEDEGEDAFSFQKVIPKISKA